MDKVGYRYFVVRMEVDLDEDGEMLDSEFTRVDRAKDELGAKVGYNNVKRLPVVIAKDIFQENEK